MKIYTKSGDGGSTSLHNGERVKKFSKRVDLYGTIDELSASITLALNFEPHQAIQRDLESLVKKLFILSTDFATPISSERNHDHNIVARISNSDVIELENKIDEYFAHLPVLKNFIVSGGSKCASFINQARTICRRAERIAVELAEFEDLNESSLHYLNRLSDFLFAAMRYSNYLTNEPEIEMDSLL